MLQGFPTVLAIAVSVLAATGVGLIADVLVTKGRIPSLIVTLDIYWGFKGVTESVKSGERDEIPNRHRDARSIGVH